MNPDKLGNCPAGIGRTTSGGDSRCDVCSGLFPLTPAHSLGEMVNQAPWRTIQTSRVSSARGALFPLPEGESQGEGKRTTYSGQANCTGPTAEVSQMAMTNDEAQNEQAGPSELSGGVRTSHFGFRSSRRKFVATAALGIASLTLPAAAPQDSSARRALIAVTFDLEMARNFPRWEDTHWDYEKGNLNEETKRYAVEAGRRVKAHGGVIHYFVVGRVFEQENVDWLKRLVEDGHPVGNHTYDHVNLKATKPEETQFRFQRAPWLVADKSVERVIRENIELCSAAMKQRLGIAPAGFRTPGGFQNGLHDVPSVQRLLLDLGFKWVSATYPVHPNTQPGEVPANEVFDGIVRAQAAAQPFAYPSGLIDVPMSPISDVGAFRNGRWKLEHFLEALRRAVAWAVEHGVCFDLLAHPAVLYPMDPEFRVIELVCELVKRAGARARLVSLEELARRCVAR